jgi:hypothetical protein
MHASPSHSGESLKNLETIEPPTTKEAWKKAKVRNKYFVRETEPSLLLGNIETGKSKKKTQLSHAASRGRAKSVVESPYLCKEHREGKKSEKILVPVHFSGGRPEAPPFADCSVARLHSVLVLDLIGLPCFYPTDLQDDAALLQPIYKLAHGPMAGLPTLTSKGGFQFQKRHPNKSRHIRDNGVVRQDHQSWLRLRTAGETAVHVSE